MLLPIGWVYVGVNQIVMIAKGERTKNRPIKSLQNANARNMLNKCYRLFESDNTLSQESENMEQKFDTVLKAKTSLININAKELWKYRDLIFLFVKRTFVSQYKQTVLGPAWAIIQPLFTTVIFTIVFGNIA